MKATILFAVLVVSTNCAFSAEDYPLVFTPPRGFTVPAPAQGNCQVAAPDGASSRSWNGPCVSGLAQGLGKAQYRLRGGPLLELNGSFYRGFPVGKHVVSPSDIPPGTNWHKVIEFYGLNLPEKYVAHFYPNDSVEYDFETDGRKYLVIYLSQSTRYINYVDLNNAARSIDYVALARITSDLRDYTLRSNDLEKFPFYGIVSGDSDSGMKITRCEWPAACLDMFNKTTTSASLKRESAEATAKEEISRIDGAYAYQTNRLMASAKRDEALLARSRDRKAALGTAPAGRLYALGSEAEQDGDFVGSLEAYRALIQRFPDSPLATSAAARLGTVQAKLDNSTGTQSQVGGLPSHGGHQQTQGSETQATKSDQRTSCLQKVDKCEQQCSVANATTIGALAGAALSHNHADDALKSAQNAADNGTAACSQCQALRDSCD